MEQDAFIARLRGWLGSLANAHGAASKPVVVGLSAPQGAGKTTITRQLCELLRRDGIRAVSISIDDFYLTRREQIALALRNQGNPYLQHRGYPGTHDVEQGARVLSALKGINGHGRVRLPCYDRSAYQGMGDRLPRDKWPAVEAPLDVVLFEGWMLGFTPVEASEFPDHHFLVINDQLKRYAIWLDFLDAFIWLEPDNPNFVLRWRVEAEERSKAAGKAGMTAEEIESFVARFLPAYKTYLPGLRQRRQMSAHHSCTS